MRLIYNWWRQHLSRINIWLFVGSTPAPNEGKQQISFRPRHPCPSLNDTHPLTFDPVSEKKCISSLNPVGIFCEFCRALIKSGAQSGRPEEGGEAGRCFVENLSLALPRFTVAPPPTPVPGKNSTSPFACLEKLAPLKRCPLLPTGDWWVFSSIINFEAEPQLLTILQIFIGHSVSINVTVRISVRIGRF